MMCERKGHGTMHSMGFCCRGFLVMLDVLKTYLLLHAFVLVLHMRATSRILVAFSPILTTSGLVIARTRTQIIWVASPGLWTSCVCLRVVCLLYLLHEFALGVPVLLVWMVLSALVAIPFMICHWHLSRWMALALTACVSKPVWPVSCNVESIPTFDRAFWKSFCSRLVSIVVG